MLEITPLPIINGTHHIGERRNTDRQFELFKHPVENISPCILVDPTAHSREVKH